MDKRMKSTTQKPAGAPCTCMHVHTYWFNQQRECGARLNVFLNNKNKGSLPLPLNKTCITVNYCVQWQQSPAKTEELGTNLGNYW